MNANANQAESPEVTYLRAEAACPRALRRAIVTAVYATYDASWTRRADDAWLALAVACSLHGLDGTAVCAIVRYNVEIGNVDATF